MRIVAELVEIGTRGKICWQVYMLLNFDHSKKVEIYVTANKEGWISRDTGFEHQDTAIRDAKSAVSNPGIPASTDIPHYTVRKET